MWALGEELEVYFRPESGGVLASPCDEVPWPPSLPPTDADALERLADRLAKLAPGLGLAAVRRAWACLRTFAPDRMPVIGPDPRVEGLFWLVALGGSGMSVGVGAGELLAAVVAGREHPVAPDQALTGLMALEGMTTHAAIADGTAAVAGRIGVGCRADLTAFAVDPVTAPADELAFAPIQLTMTDGTVTHRA